jgi:SulP family sulfate permease
MTATVVVVVGTHNLAIGVFVGVLLSSLFFAAKIGKILYVGSTLSAEGLTRRYNVIGQVFFASAERFIASFDLREAVEQVQIDVSRAHFWDITAVGALDKIVLKFRREGTEVEIIGLNKASETMVDRFAVHDKAETVERLLGH